MFLNPHEGGFQSSRHKPVQFPLPLRVGSPNCRGIGLTSVVYILAIHAAVFAQNFESRIEGQHGIANPGIFNRQCFHATTVTNTFAYFAP